MPRVTTAAWLVMPPVAVRMPSAASMPWMSSGFVSLRTRIVGFFSAFRRNASSAWKTAMPLAAPGEAGSPFASTAFVAFGSMRWCSSWSRSPGGTRSTASFRSISPSFAISTAMRTAAGPVRLPVRVCSM